MFRCALWVSCFWGELGRGVVVFDYWGLVNAIVLLWGFCFGQWVEEKACNVFVRLENACYDCLLECSFF